MNTMRENSSMDGDANLVDSFFLPGGLLDPEQECDDQYQYQYQEMNHTHALFTHTLNHNDGCFAASQPLQEQEHEEEQEHQHQEQHHRTLFRRMHPANKTNNSMHFPPIVIHLNPHNPWSDTANIPVSTPMIENEFYDNHILTDSAVAKQSFKILPTNEGFNLHNYRELQSTNTTTGPSNYLSRSRLNCQLHPDNLFHHQSALAFYSQQHSQELSLSEPPLTPTVSQAFRSSRLINCTKYDHADDEESIESIPREVVHENIQEQQFHSENHSSTSSLSHSTVVVPFDEEDDFNDLSIEQQTNKSNGPDMSSSTHHQSLASETNVLDVGVTHKLDEYNQGNDFHVNDTSSKNDNKENAYNRDKYTKDIPKLIESESCCEPDHTSENVPLAPMMQKDNTQHVKARKRRIQKNAKNSLMPTEPSSSKSSTSQSRAPLPNLISKESSSKRERTQRRFRISTPPKQRNQQKVKASMPSWLIVLMLLQRALLLAISGLVFLCKAAFAEAIADGPQKTMYIFAWFSPLIAEVMVSSLCLPYWISHVLSCIGVWFWCSPSKQKKQNCYSPISLVRVAYVLWTCSDGFSHQHPRFLTLQRSMRMLIVFAVLLLKQGFCNSPMLLVSLCLQIILASLRSADILLFLIGLASLRLKRTLVVVPSRPTP